MVLTSDSLQKATERVPGFELKKIVKYNVTPDGNMKITYLNTKNELVNANYLNATGRLDLHNMMSRKSLHLSFERFVDKHPVVWECNSGYCYWKIIW